MTKPSGTHAVTSSEPQLKWHEFRDIAKLELSGNACRAHQELVRRPENAVRWLRVLRTTMQAVEQQTAAAKSFLHAHPGRQAVSGELAREYRKARRAYEVGHARREHVLMHIADRIAEAKDIITEQDAITARALELMASRLMKCDSLLGQGEIALARQMLRTAMDSLGCISAADTGGSLLESSSR